MRGNGTSQLVEAIRRLQTPGMSLNAAKVISPSPLTVQLAGSGLKLDADDIDMPRHIKEMKNDLEAGDTIMLLVSADGQEYFALGVF